MILVYDIFLDTWKIKTTQYPCDLGKWLKVRQIRNDFFKLTFLPKNEQMNSFLLLCDLFSFINAFLESSISSKKQTNKFDFTTCRLVFIHFLEESEDISKLTDLYLGPTPRSGVWTKCWT